MDSSDSHRWVFQDQDNSDIDFEDDENDDDDDVHDDDDDFTVNNDSEEEDDSLYQKLIRTGPRIDSFGVEALEVPGAHRSDFEVPVFVNFTRLTA
nr:potassium transporter 7-like [Tanacetum cinerariifolium]